MNNNVFLVETEYHLYLAFIILYSNYKLDTNHIYIVKGRINKTFISDDEHVVFHYLPHKDYGTAETFKEMFSFSPLRFFYYQEGYSDNLYLAYHFHKKGVRVSLVQDGMKPYPYPSRNFKHPLAHIVFDTWKCYKEMVARKALIPAFVREKNYYGYSPYNDDLWLQYPDKFVNVNHKELVKIPELTPDIVPILNKYFGFDGTNYQTDAILFVAEYLIRYEDCMKTEKEILSYLVEKFSGRTIYYKIHPGTPKQCIDDISATFPSLIIVNDGIPAELHICNLHDTIVLSMFSTACLTNNPDCRLYWTWRLYPSDNRLLSQINHCNPTDHIIEVNRLEEIQ